MQKEKKEFLKGNMQDPEDRLEILKILAEGNIGSIYIEAEFLPVKENALRVEENEKTEKSRKKQVDSIEDMPIDVETTANKSSVLADPFA